MKTVKEWLRNKKVKKELVQLNPELENVINYWFDNLYRVEPLTNIVIPPSLVESYLNQKYIFKY